MIQTSIQEIAIIGFTKNDIIDVAETGGKNKTAFCPTHSTNAI